MSEVYKATKNKIKINTTSDSDVYKATKNAQITDVEAYKKTLGNEIQQDIAGKINYRFTPSFSRDNTPKIKSDIARAKASDEVASNITRQVAETVPIFQKENFTPSGLKSAVAKDIKDNQENRLKRTLIPSVNYDSDEAELEAIRQKRTNAFVQKEKAQKNWNDWRNSEGTALQKGLDYIGGAEVNNLRQDLSNKENEYNLIDEEYTLKKQKIAEKRIQQKYGVNGSEYIALLEQKKDNAQSDSEKNYYENEIKRTRNELYGKTNIFEHIGNIAKEGLLQYNKGVAATVDFFLGTPAKWLGFENNIFTQANKDSTRWLEEASAETYKGSQSFGDTQNLTGQFGTALIAAVPDLLLTILSGGASKAPKLGNAAIAAANPTFLNTLKNEIIQTVKSPIFYTSFVRELGTNYEENLENGANEAQATLAALFASAVTAKMEIGGFQSLGDELAETKSAWRKLYKWALSSMEEGLEEPAQTSATNLINKIVYDHDKKIVSTTDEDSVFNLKRAAKEFAIGTFVGAALGGGQLTFSGIVNAKSDSQYKQIGKAAIKNTNIQEIIDYAKSSPNDVVRSIARQVDANTISDADAGRVYQYAVTSVNEQFDQVESVDDLNKVISEYFMTSTVPKSVRNIASAKFAEKLADMNIDPETYEGLTPEKAMQTATTVESDNVDAVAPVEQSGEVSETPVESQQERETVFTEPTNQEIYRDPTDEENAEAIFGKRKSAKQRHIIDVAKKLDSNMKVVFVDKNSKSLNGKNGKYNRDTNTMYIAKDLETNDIKLVEAYVEVFKHEFVHRLELRKAYKSFKDYLFNKSVAFEKYAKARLNLNDEVSGKDKTERTREQAINELVNMYIENINKDSTLSAEYKKNFTREKAEREAVADFIARTLFKGNTDDLRLNLESDKGEDFVKVTAMETDLEFFEEMANTDRTLLQKIIDAIRDLINSIKGITNLEKDLQYIEERLVRVYESADNKKTATESGEVYQNSNDNILQKNKSNDIISNQESGVEEDGSTNPKLLAGRKVSATNRGENYQRQYGANTEIIRISLGNAQQSTGISGKDVAAGESGWLSARNFPFARTMGRGLDKNFLGSIQGVALKNTDSIGRIITPELQEKLSPTVFKTEEGTVISFFHWSPNSFNEFKFGDGAFHLGTLSAAITVKNRDAQQREGHILEGYVISKNPLITPDLGKFGAYSVCEFLLDKEIITKDELKKISQMDGFLSDKYDAPANVYVRELLKSMGYDTYLYQNLNEDLGSWSVGVFDADQIVIIAENGVLKENSGVTEADPQGPANFMPETTTDKSYSSDDLSALQEQLLDRYEKGEITREEYQGSLKKYFDDAIKEAEEYSFGTKVGLIKRNAKLHGKIKRQNEQLARRRSEISKEITAQREERATKQKNIEHIRKTVSRIDKMLRTNSDNKHVPEELKEEITKFVSVFVENDRSPFDKEDLRIIYLAYSDALRETSAEESNSGLDEDVMQDIKTLQERLDGKTLRDLNYYETLLVRDIVDNFARIIKSANELFIEGKRYQFETIGNTAMNELVSKDSKKENVFTKAVDKGIVYNNMTPVFFFDKIGGVFKTLFDDVLNAQNKWFKNVDNSKTFITQMKEKYGYSHWGDDKLKLDTEKGDNIEITVEQAMLLYATAKREYSNKFQKAEHLFRGGVVIEPSKRKIEEVVKELRKASKEKNKSERESKTESIVTSFTKEVDSRAHRITPADIVKIKNWLTDDQIDYMDAMVEYLSTDMAVLGNEISMELYGIKKYNEDYYIPYNSAQNFLYSQPGVNNESRLKHQSFTKNTVVGANNPLVLSDFSTVCADHINRMCMYNALTIPLENMNKIFNFKNAVTGDMNQMSIKSEIERVYGEPAVSYIETFLEDMNGNVRVSHTDKAINRWISKFKKGAVFASASVVIQQPSSIIRAMAYIKPKYFTSTTFKFSERDYQECIKYAPVAGIKEMGRFDTGVGAATTNWLLQETPKRIKNKIKAFFDVSDSTYRDDKLSYFAAKADEITWGHIWAAVKSEIADTTDLKVGSREYFEACGKRFTDVVNRTQVYDSTISRSQMMRSKSTGAQMLTAFMSEPTVSLNLLMNAAEQAKTGGKEGKRFAAGAVAAFVGSVALNSLLKSFVTAARDDDEEETYFEKYVTAATDNFLSDVFPHNLIPFIKDIVSIYEGYTVERADMNLFSDLAQSIKYLNSESKTDYEKFESVLGSLAAFLGLPVKNVLRDGRAVYNLCNDIFVNDKVDRAVNKEIKGYIGELSDNNTYKSLDDEDKEKLEKKITKTVRDVKEAENDKQKRDKFDELYAEKRKSQKSYEKMREEMLKEGYTSDEITLGVEIARIAYMKSIGIDVGEYLLYKISTNEKHADKDKSGGVSKQERNAAIREMEIDEKIKNYFLNQHK